MEHTEGLGGLAEVWVDGALLRVCDGVSPPGQPAPPGPLEGATFRYTTDETVSWAEAMASNASRKIMLEPVKCWAYVGFGRVEQVMPVVVHFGLLRMEDPNWSTDERLVGRYVCVPIDRLELVPAGEGE